MPNCTDCNGTGADAAKTVAARADGRIDGKAYIRCWTCNGNGLEPIYPNTVQLAATLHSGHRAIFEVYEPDMKRRSYASQSANSRLIEMGRLIAVKDSGHWYNRTPGRASWVERFTDPVRIAYFESRPLAQ